MSEYLFAYGTLQAAHAPKNVRPLLEKVRSVGEGSVAGILYDFGDYPGAVLDPSSDCRIFGTVFELPDDVNLLSEFDEYEEFNPNAAGSSLFVRTLQLVLLESGRVQPCWIYVYNHDPGPTPVVKNGRYAK